MEEYARSWCSSSSILATSLSQTELKILMLVSTATTTAYQEHGRALDEMRKSLSLQ